MNPLSYYTRSKESWTTEDITQVRTGYETTQLDIRQLADLQKRTPGCIGYKLKSLGIITHNAHARGYKEYKASNLYTEICGSYDHLDALKKKRAEERLKRKEEKAKSKLNPTNTNEIVLQGSNTVSEGTLTKNAKSLITEEIKALKEEVQDLKKDMKQMLSYITQLYEFETSQ